MLKPQGRVTIKLIRETITSSLVKNSIIVWAIKLKLISSVIEHCWHWLFAKSSSMKVHTERRRQSSINGLIHVFYEWLYFRSWQTLYLHNFNNYNNMRSWARTRSNKYWNVYKVYSDSGTDLAAGMNAQILNHRILIHSKYRSYIQNRNGSEWVFLDFQRNEDTAVELTYAIK